MLRDSRDASTLHHEAIRTLTVASATRVLTRLRTTVTALDADPGQPLAEDHRHHHEADRRPAAPGPSDPLHWVPPVGANAHTPPGSACPVYPGELRRSTHTTTGQQQCLPGQLPHGARQMDLFSRR